MSKRKKVIISAIVIFAVFCIIHVFLIRGKSVMPNVSRMSTGWTVRYKGEEYEKVDIVMLNKTVPGPYKKGETMELSARIPGEANLHFPTIFLRTKYSAFQAYVDDEPVMDVGMENVGTDRFVGCFQRMISLPEHSGGKLFRVVLYICEDDAFSSIDAPIVGPFESVERGYMRENLFPIMAGMFLVIFGIAFALVTLGFLPSVPEMLEPLFAAFMAADYGVYTLTFYNALFFFIDDKYSTYLEYISLYMLVPYTVLVLFSLHKNSGHRKLLLTIGAVVSFLCMSLIVLHFAAGIHMCRTLPLYHVMAGIAILLVNGIFIYDLIKKNLTIAGAVQLGGLVTLSDFLLVGMILYKLSRSGVISMSFLPTGIFPAGGMFFLMAHLVTYLLYIAESYARNREYIHLERLAYEDALTGLYNRPRSEIFMNELDKKDEDYCIMSVDLNGLKIVNDHYGHSAGDQYIREVSAILKKKYDDRADVCRVGGDEFLLIFDENDIITIRRYVMEIYDQVEHIRLKNCDYHCSVAAGFAFRHEFQERKVKAQEVYMLADERMYKEKRRLHNEMGISIRDGA